MQELASVGTSIATIIAIIVAVASTAVVAWAGFQWVTAAGDPQQISKAKQTLIGAFIGLGISGLAFIGPRIFVEMVIKPVGGVSIETEVGLNCDGILRNQLVFQRGASTPDRMNVLVSQIQANQSECASDVWAPEIVALSDLDAASTPYCLPGAILTPGTSTAKFTAAVLNTFKVGDQELPASLASPSGTTDHLPRSVSGRDSGNNIFVIFSDDTAKRPSDSATCWLYYARLKQWHANFS